MSTYLVLIYGDEAEWEAMSSETGEQLAAGHRAFQAAAGAAVLGGHELARTTHAVSLRGSEGRMARTDGPFPETKEVLGGYYLVQADLEDVVGWAGLLFEASAGHSRVELREALRS